MRSLAELFLIYLTSAYAQSPKTVFVENPAHPDTYASRFGTIMRSGESDSDLIKRVLKKCSSFSIVSDTTSAEYVATPFKGGTDLKDASGRVIFTTKAHNEMQRGKYVCRFGGAMANLLASNHP